MFGIQGPAQFEYCMKGQTLDVNTIDDAAEYRDMRQVFDFQWGFNF